MHAVSEDLLKPVLFPLWGEGLGLGEHAWRWGKADGQWVALCDERTPVLSIGVRMDRAGHPCLKCQAAMNEIEQASNLLKKHGMVAAWPIEVEAARKPAA